jgi:hypothetical protein
MRSHVNVTLSLETLAVIPGKNGQVEMAPLFARVTRLTYAEARLSSL